MLAAIAIGTMSCSSNQSQSGTDPAKMQLSSTTAGSCDIDAVKMCQATGSSGPAQPPPPATMPTVSYGPTNVPESVEFQIPAGQTVKLMCYYDPQHGSVYRADATPESPLSGNSVEYMKKQGFCTNQ
jgi:hypothetical protein